MAVSDQNLVWVDMEMTGLIPEEHRVIEIATIVTDVHLQVLAEGPVIPCCARDCVTGDGRLEYRTRKIRPGRPCARE